MSANNPNAFFAVVFYTDHDGASHSISALVLAASEMDAIESAIEAVQSLPHCASIEGGILEPMTDSPNARGASLARMPVAGNA